ncbi:MAG TPA: hypothetical protein PKA10_00530 [Selenomonadales bacterium]|nr:hypothetical protein [Selenomonadales bacterium]
MEKLILVAIGLLAVGYISRMVWSSIHGKSACSCGGACSDKGCAASRAVGKK